MRINEVKETREVVVRTEYIAMDGTVFKDRGECEKYESTCKCVIMSGYKQLVKGSITEYELFEVGCEDFYYDLVEIKNESDREIVNKALKYGWEKAKLITDEEIGKIIMVAREYDNNLTGYHTSIDKLLNRMKEKYEKELNKEVEQ